MRIIIVILAMLASMVMYQNCGKISQEMSEKASGEVVPDSNEGLETDDSPSSGPTPTPTPGPTPTPTPTDNKISLGSCFECDSGNSCMNDDTKIATCTDHYVLESASLDQAEIDALKIELENLCESSSGFIYRANRLCTDVQEIADNIDPDTGNPDKYSCSNNHDDIQINNVVYDQVKSDNYHLLDLKEFEKDGNDCVLEDE